MMKKATIYIYWIAVGVTFIAFAIMGIKLLDNNYDFMAEAYVGAASSFVMFICSLIRVFGNRCTHCGKTITDNSRYCPFCGKEIKG